MNNVDVFVVIVIFGLIALAIFNFLKQVLNQSEQYLKVAEYSPKMNTNSWDQHQRRLNKYGLSKYRKKYFHVDSDGKVYYIDNQYGIVYCK